MRRSRHLLQPGAAGAIARTRRFSVRTLPAVGGGRCGTIELYLCKEDDPMADRLSKTFSLSTLLMAPASVAAMAQSAAPPAAGTPPARTGVGGWISGHPVADVIVVLAIIVVVVAGTYFMRQRSRA